MITITSQELLEEVRKSHEDASGKLILMYDSYSQELVKLSELRLNENSLSNCDFNKINEYKESMVEGDKFPLPIINEYNVLIDGHHRVMAKSMIGAEYILYRCISFVSFRSWQKNGDIIFTNTVKYIPQ